MVELKVTAIGNSLGIVLPKEALKQLHVEKGDKLFLIESPEGFVLTSYDPEVKEAVEAARVGMSRYRNALRELAK